MNMITRNIIINWKQMWKFLVISVRREQLVDVITFPGPLKSMTRGAGFHKRFLCPKEKINDNTRVTQTQFVVNVLSCITLLPICTAHREESCIFCTVQVMCHCLQWKLSVPHKEMIRQWVFTHYSSWTYDLSPVSFSTLCYLASVTMKCNGGPKHIGIESFYCWKNKCM